MYEITPTFSRAQDAKEFVMNELANKKERVSAVRLTTKNHNSNDTVVEFLDVNEIVLATTKGGFKFGKNSSSSRVLNRTLIELGFDKTLAEKVFEMGLDEILIEKPYIPWYL